MHIRDAKDADLPQILEIVNALVLTTTIEWTDVPHTLADRQVWLENHHDAGDVVLVAEDDDGVIAGFANYGDFRDSTKWPGYRFTVEHTVHVRERYFGRGIGRLLVDGLMQRAAAAGKHVMVAGIDAENHASLDFHRRLGFVEVGRMPAIGWKLEHWLGLVFMQRRIVSGDVPAAYGT
ncbi:MAG TPA: GNAT family N-acetyltransferase [Polyangiales bacterium]|nr:GNAT family N-acetyltransferase [Polyangiales bacterium]